MIKEKEKLFRKLLMLIDLTVVLASFLISVALRQNIHSFYVFDIFPDKQVMDDLASMHVYFQIFPVILFAWWAALTSAGLYESLRIKSFFEVIWGIIKSVFLVMIIISTIVFIFKLSFISRSLILLYFSVTCTLLTAERWIIIRTLRHYRKRGYNTRNVLIVGTGGRAVNFMKMVYKHNEWGLKIIGLIDIDPLRLGKTIGGKKVIGLLDDIPDILTQNVVDEVIFIVPRKWLSVIEKSIMACEIQGVKSSIAADFFNTKISHSVSSDLEGIPLLGFHTTVGEEWQLLVKRLFDIIVSIAGIIICFPLFIAVFAAIKSLSPSDPVLFSQVRSGLNGRKFVMYKFRTMINGAENKKEELSTMNEMGGPVFKMRNDPRITGLGRFLRRTSLDELPQLFNILKGNMSFVGPRPPLPSEVEKYEIWQRRRLSMKPGLTCLWQVNGRNNLDFDKWMKLDLKYIDNWSLSLDVKILLKTIPVVLFSIGAR